MIVSEDFLQKLRQQFKLNLYEVKVWTALLSRGTATAGELSEISDVPRSRTYDILESLEKKGFILMKMGKPIKYLALKPQDVVERAKTIAQLEANNHIKQLENLNGTDLFNELDLLYKQGIEFIEPSDMSTTIKGRQNAFLHLDNRLKEAKENVSFLTTAKDIVRKYNVIKETLQDLNKNSVKIKVAVPIIKENVDVVKKLMNLAEVKNIKKPNGRVCVIDNKEVVAMLMDDNEVHANYDVAIWTKSPYLATLINDMFAHVWEKLEPAGKIIKKF